MKKLKEFYKLNEKIISWTVFVYFLTGVTFFIFTLPFFISGGKNFYSHHKDFPELSYWFPIVISVFFGLLTILAIIISKLDGKKTIKTIEDKYQEMMDKTSKELKRNADIMLLTSLETSLQNNLDKLISKINDQSNLFMETSIPASAHKILNGSRGIEKTCLNLIKKILCSPTNGSLLSGENWLYYQNVFSSLRILDYSSEAVRKYLTSMIVFIPGDEGMILKHLYSAIHKGLSTNFHDVEINDKNNSIEVIKKESYINVTYEEEMIAIYKFVVIKHTKESLMIKFTYKDWSLQEKEKEKEIIIKI